MIEKFLTIRPLDIWQTALRNDKFSNKMHTFSPQPYIEFPTLNLPIKIQISNPEIQKPNPNIDDRLFTQNCYTTPHLKEEMP